MSWALLGIALLVTYVLQTAVVNVLDPRLLGQPPVDLFLALALVYGLRAPRDDARIAGFLVGLAQDFSGVGPLGIHAFALGLTALLLTSNRDVFRINIWLVRLILAFIMALPAQFVLAAHVRLWLGSAEPAASLLLGGLLTAFAAALLAATATALPWLSAARTASRGSSARW